MKEGDCRIKLDDVFIYSVFFLYKAALSKGTVEHPANSRYPWYPT